MVVGIRSLALAVAVPVLVASLAACGTPEPEVSAVSVAPVAAAEPAVSVETVETVVSVETAMNVEASDDAPWECPQDVRLLQALQIAHENLIGRPAETVAELEASGILIEDVGLAATIDAGKVVGLASRSCAAWSYSDLDLDPRCMEELDRFSIDISVGVMVARHLGSGLGPIEQARAVGVDHGPYLAYSWNVDASRLELLDDTCPDHDQVTAALRAFTASLIENICRVARGWLETASELHEAATDVPPVDEQQLVELGTVSVASDEYDIAPDGSVVPQPGSDCERFEREQSGATGVSGEGPTHDCGAQRMTLETAVEAYYALHGEAPADEQVLVTEGLLRELSDEFRLLADGTVVATPGGGCE